MLTNFKRIFNFAVNDFGRNKGISIAAIFVLIVTIMLVSCLFFFQGISSFLISEVQNKIDITAYFKDGTSEQDILKIRDQILNLSSDIKGVQYTSKDQALAEFNEKHKDNAVLARALEEVGENPFLPSLSIKTSGDPSQYEELANILQNAEYSKLIEKVDFSQKKDTIDKVYSITSNINRFGIIAGIILIIVAMLIVYNTIKLAIDNSKEEINTMKIVGASDWFIRGPYVIQGAIYGFIAFIFCIFIAGLFAYFLSSKIAVILPGFSAFDYFLKNFWILILIQMGFGIGVGILSSFLAVRKHLEN